MISKEELKTLELQYGDVLHVVGKGGKWELVLKPPPLDNYELFIANTQNPARKHQAQYGLIRSMVVYPTLEEFDRKRERWVGMCEAACADHRFNEFIGLEVEAAGK